jgi:GNAT superfamily N-acetyltransferase
MAAVIDRSAVILRPATVADAERIASLLTDEGYPAGASDIAERLTRFADDRGTVVVADLDGEVLGFVAVARLPRFEHADWIARVVALVVEAGVRERGLGHLLMEAAETWAAERDCAFVEVTAGHHRPEARHLYESLGYDPTATAYYRRRL